VRPSTSAPAIPVAEKLTNETVNPVLVNNATRIGRNTTFLINHQNFLVGNDSLFGKPTKANGFQFFEYLPLSTGYTRERAYIHPADQSVEHGVTWLNET